MVIHWNANRFMITFSLVVLLTASFTTLVQWHIPWAKPHWSAPLAREVKLHELAVLDTALKQKHKSVARLGGTLDNHTSYSTVQHEARDNDYNNAYGRGCRMLELLYRLNPPRTPKYHDYADLAS